MFENLEELKERLDPALSKRESDMLFLGFNKTKEDIWNDLSFYKWKKSSFLTLNEMVDDILKYLPRWDSDNNEENNNI